MKSEDEARVECDECPISGGCVGKCMRADDQASSQPPYYVGGPFLDGEYAVCELSTGRVLRKFRGPEDLLLAAGTKCIVHPREGIDVTITASAPDPSSVTGMGTELPRENNPTQSSSSVLLNALSSSCHQEGLSDDNLLKIAKSVGAFTRSATKHSMMEGWSTPTIIYFESVGYLRKFLEAATSVIEDPAAQRGD